MSEPHYDDPQVPWVSAFDVPEVLPVRKGQAWLAWLLIFAAVGFIVVLPHVRPLVKEAAGSDGVQLVVMQLQSRWLLSALPFIASDAERDNMYQQVQTLNMGSVNQRFGFIVFAGEWKGPEEALRLLANLRRDMKERDFQPTETQAETLATLERLYQSYDRGDWRPFAAQGPEAELLRNQLGWSAKLALAPGKAPPEKETIVPRAEVQGDVQRTLFTMIGAMVGGSVLFLCGLAGLIGLFILALTGRLQQGVRCGSSHHGVYAETFALWMILFLILNIGAAEIAPPGWLLGTIGVGMLSSLVIVVWPVLRGIPWSTVRQDIGWNFGRAFWLEPFIGIATYAMSLPILAVGLVFVLILMMITGMAAGSASWGRLVENGFDPAGGPAHPLIEFFSKPSWSGYLQILFVAAIVAPIVEETMFRGFLYRHLREAARGFGWAASFIVSAFVVSFIFAVIHPQGVVAVPALMALAFGFTIAREWRGTLIPSMVAHGMNNGLLMVMLMLALS